MLAHIIAADFNDRRDFYSDIGNILYNHKIINEDDKEILNRVAGFRNRLTHEYLTLDYDIMIDIVNNHLSDFTRLLSIIKKYCNI